MASDAGLADTRRIADARRGAPEALAVLYRQYGDEVMAVAYRLTGSQADAEDVLHDVFLSLPERLRRYEERGSFAAWLRKVAVRVALMHLRTRRRRREVALDSVSHIRSQHPAEERAVSNDIARALAHLSPRLRVVFVLKVVEGYAHADIAELLGISTKASEVRLVRAIKKLRAVLEVKR